MASAAIQSASDAKSAERADASACLAVVAGKLGALMATLDISIVNSALATIQGEIGASGTEGTWVATAYMVAADAGASVHGHPWSRRHRSSDVFDFGKLTMLVTPSIRWSFLDFSKNRAAVRQSEAQCDEAGAQYRQAILHALQDAETPLSRFGDLRVQLAGLGRAEFRQRDPQRSTTRASAPAPARSSKQLGIQRQRLSAAISVAQGKAALTNSYIAVQKSLGLGWSTTGRCKALTQISLIAAERKSRLTSCVMCYPSPMEFVD